MTWISSRHTYRFRSTYRRLYYFRLQQGDFALP